MFILSEEFFFFFNRATVSLQIEGKASFYVEKKPGFLLFYLEVGMGAKFECSLLLQYYK